MRKRILSFLVLFMLSTLLPLVSSHPGVIIRGVNIISGEKDAFVIVNWGIDEYDFRRDIYYFNGTIIHFYRSGNWGVENVANSSVVMDSAFLMRDNASWLFLRPYYVPENNTRVVEVYRFSNGSCGLQGKVTVALGNYSSSIVQVFYEKRAFAVRMEGLTGKAVYKYKIDGDRIISEQIEGFPEKSKEYYAYEEGVPEGGSILATTGMLSVAPRLLKYLIM